MTCTFTRSKEIRVMKSPVHHGWSSSSLNHIITLRYSFWILIRHLSTYLVPYCLTFLKSSGLKRNHCRSYFKFPYDVHEVNSTNTALMSETNLGTYTCINLDRWCILARAEQLRQHCVVMFSLSPLHHRCCSANRVVALKWITYKTHYSNTLSRLMCVIKARPATAVALWIKMEWSSH